jgi:thioesterase domain-containing protein
VVGGHLFFYDNLARHLDPEQPVYALPAQGTDGRQPPHTTIEAMAVHAIGLMREVQPAGPYALLGFCSGGVIAFEIARQLEARGESASLLALVDSWAPGFGLGSWRNLLFPAGGSRDWRLLQERIYQMVLHPLGLSRLRRFGKLGEAHRWALWSYQPKRLAGAAVLMRPSGSRRARNPALGWDRFVAGGVAVKVLSGQHGDLVKGPGAARLAEELAKWLP